MRPILYQWKLDRSTPFVIQYQQIPAGFENRAYDMHSAAHLGIILSGALGEMNGVYDLYITGSYQAHGNLCCPDGAEVLLITFLPEAVLNCVIGDREPVQNLLYSHFGNHPSRFRTELLRKQVREFCDRYAGEVISGTIADLQRLWLDIIALVCVIAAEALPFEAGVSRKNHLKLLPLFSALAAMKHVPMSLPDAARICSMSESHFSRLFRACTGMTFSGYELAFRLNCAAAELDAADGDVNIKQLASEWGFYDTSHFSKSYKRFFGVPPSCRR